MSGQYDRGTDANQEGEREWAVLEILGHRRRVGVVSEEVKFGKALVRIDVPKPPVDGHERWETEFYGPDSIFCLTPVPEARGREEAEYYWPRPVQKALTAPCDEDDDPYADEPEPGEFDKDM